MFQLICHTYSITRYGGFSMLNTFPDIGLIFDPRPQKSASGGRGGGFYISKFNPHAEEWAIVVTMYKKVIAFERSILHVELSTQEPKSWQPL
jgi:hypothetical protein